jgi:hypothetical protein
MLTPEPRSDRPRSLLGWIFGSDEAALNFIRRLGLEPFLIRCVELLNRLLTWRRKP